MEPPGLKRESCGWALDPLIRGCQGGVEPGIKGMRRAGAGTGKEQSGEGGRLARRGGEWCGEPELRVGHDKRDMSNGGIRSRTPTAEADREAAGSNSGLQGAS